MRPGHRRDRSALIKECAPKIRELRDQYGLTLAQIAERYGVSCQTIREVLRAQRFTENVHRKEVKHDAAH